MSVRLSTEAGKYLEFNVSKKFYRNDSGKVLHHINSNKKLQTHLSTRVYKILEYTEVEQWRWIPTLENVAYDCTREIDDVNIIRYRNTVLLRPYLSLRTITWG
ncbi:hypothetical protein JTB14_024389 [Gonioctena quinquepunctata]|nr:hypothetical protein JTB14_024389 [Gonioctena quinquepunctata]